jgi:AraC family carnitine catabolism transcriptional activator
MRKVAFVLLPEFSNLGIAAATEPLFVANWLAQRPVFEWSLLSVDGKPVRASNGVVVEVDGDLGAAAGCNSVFLLASFDPHVLVRDPKVLRWLKRIAAAGVELGGIENGSLVLAESGLLQGHRAAIHWDNLQGFAEQYPRVQAVPQLFCRSGNRITCAGASATLDLMIAWMGWHGEGVLALEVGEHLLIGAPRTAETPQRATPADRVSATHPVIARAEALMREHLDEPLSCADLARRVGLSLRQLERCFKRELRSSVLQQYRQIRMARAHQLLQQTKLSVTEVAIASGFASPEYFCRLYRQRFGCLPSRDRRQSISAPVLRRAVSAG